ncbi:hypothetical protein [Sutcliffiella rhizosphaerae]|uniref:Uncharacterized protein n=1 Tax=Sutcliffiella rhizosphaerae TaxID=2880967 RepID=A0ABN8AJ37_9BACI|nr:hypothetical protein [Sutcliffiella rhizosphaerae]CAG9623742.1 hypothetical protein BACCIP111883_04574 [Sutcliffiella rhizosphaerae]
MLSKVTSKVLKSKVGHKLSVPKAKSELEIVLNDGRSESFQLSSTGPVDFIIFNPEETITGDTIVPLEILKFEVEAISKVLWPGEKVKMAGGKNIGHESLPIKGEVRIPKGKNMTDGVESEQLVYIQVDCPLGKLHNVTAVPMVGKIKGIPPIGVKFKTTGLETPLFDENMEKQLTVVACGSVTGT